jgi:hypothetical protein
MCQKKIRGENVKSIGRFAMLGGLAALLLANGGCGSDLSLVPATASVKYKGNNADGVTVTFIFPDGKISSGVTDTNGKCNLTTNGRAGAPPGTAKVTVTKATSAEGAAMPSPENLKPEDMIKKYSKVKNPEDIDQFQPKNELPTKYASADSSGLTAEVVASGSNDFVFELVD